MTINFLLPLPKRSCLTRGMKVDVGIWGKLTRVVIFLAVVAILLMLGEWYLPLIQQNERMRKEILRQEAQIKKSEQLLRQQKAEFDALRYDPKAVERLAREQLGYARPGETIIQFEPVTNSAAH